MSTLDTNKELFSTLFSPNEYVAVNMFLFILRNQYFGVNT